MTMYETRSTGTSSALGSLMLAAAGCICACAAAHAEALDSSTQRRLRESTFEVVQGKPEADPLTYEKELPLDLLPFMERTSKYRPVGTAFVIDRDRFVTAAHVVAAGTGSQFGPLAIRDSNGVIYPVDTITKYSAAEDFAEFTVRGGPRVKPLEIDASPQLNQPVFAVGNALGEGIVIRDGLYTSDTPEERAGRWKWLRFSAAASPGNSGGPLVDAKGRVIGVILRKSPSENLNSAVRIDQVRKGTTASASIESRFVYRFPPALAGEPAEIDEHFPLPKPIAEFYAAAAAATNSSLEAVRTRYLTSHAANLFPRGENSVQLLNQLYVAQFPRAIEERSDNAWGVTDPKPQRAQLEHNGFVESVGFKTFEYLRLRAPDDMAPGAVYGDSKSFMDMLLKLLMLRRAVGPDSVRVVSLGTAQQESTYKDDYGRTWQVRAWRVPFNDSVILTVGLPTPQGYIAIAKECPSLVRDATMRELESLTSFVYVSLEGTLKQWRDYLSQPLQPDAVRSLQIQWDYGKEFKFRSKRLALNLPDSVQKVDPSSFLILKMTYFRDEDSTVWDLGGLYLSDTEQKGNWIDVLRRQRPPATLPDTFTERWQAIRTGAHPYTAVAYSTNGGTRIDAVANANKVATGQSNIAYTVSVASEGTQDARVMKRKLDAVQAGIAVLE
jgi:serine protease Do